ncbi:hypothetical protein AMTRI_Chr05g66830 [Amborella trichopoda]
MGAGWIRAKIALGLTSCTTNSDRRRHDSSQCSPENDNERSDTVKDPGFGENPSENATPVTTPRVLSQSASSSPRLHCRTQTSSSPRLQLPKGTCGLCLQATKPGQGLAIFTAECSHSFHFHCLAYHLKRGHHTCPLCNSKLAHVPIPSLDASSPRVKSFTRDNSLTGENHREIRVYDDDEPLHDRKTGRFFPIPEADDEFEVEAARREIRERRAVRLSLLPESNGPKLSEDFGVLIRVRAPKGFATGFRNPKTGFQGGGTGFGGQNGFAGPNFRPPVDVVAVVDAGSSVRADEFQSAKRSARLLASSLGSGDRLALVAFASSSKRLLPLMRMSAHGQRAVSRAMDRLGSGSGDDGSALLEAVKKARKILDDRRERNATAAIIVLTDACHSSRNATPRGSAPLGNVGAPIHIFGFGDVTGNDFSSDGSSCTILQVRDEEDFSRRVARNLTFVALDLRLEIECDGTAAEITSVYSASRSRIHHGKSSAIIKIGDLHTEEEREMLVELRFQAKIPPSLLAVKCSYKDPLTNETTTGEWLEMTSSTRGDAEVERVRGRMRAAWWDGSPRTGGGRGCRIEGSTWRDGSPRMGDPAATASLLDTVMRSQVDSNGEPLTPTSAWRAAERLARVASARKSLRPYGDLHGLENARF